MAELNDQELVRREKLKKLIDLGIEVSEQYRKED